MSDELKEDESNPKEADATQAPPPEGAAPGEKAPGATDAVQIDEEPGPDLPAQLEQARAQAAEYLDGWQRARAEFANYRKRVEREREEIFRETTASVLKQLLPIIDDLERATQSIPEDMADHTWTQGVVLIKQKLHTLLQGHGLEPIDPLGEAFDPARHEAIGTDDGTEMESGHITTVLQKGYAYGDKVLRVALVRVAS
jgi:molecular chaperone GrpE